MDNILEINKIYKEFKKTIDEKHANIAKDVLSEIEEYVNGSIVNYEKDIEYCAKQGFSMFTIPTHYDDTLYKVRKICEKHKGLNPQKVKEVMLSVIYRTLYKKYGRYYSVELKEDEVVIKWDKVKTNKWWIRNYFTEDWYDAFLYSIVALVLTIFCGFVTGMFIEAVFGTINANLFFGIVLFVGLVIALSIIIKHIYKKIIFTLHCKKSLNNNK